MLSHQRLYQSLLLLFLVINTYFISRNGFNKTVEDVTIGLYQHNSCSASLASQVEILKTEYRKLLQGVTHVAVIGFPDYPNKGDSAIWSGQNILLDALNIKSIYSCSRPQDFNSTVLRERLVKNGGPEKTAIMLTGGGNFGDLWYGEQTMRDMVVEQFLDYRIRSFPQTYKFEDPNKLQHTQKIYAKHHDLQLAARDTRSYADLQKDFGTKHDIILVPDAATMLITFSPQKVVENKGYSFTFLARTDKEGKQNHWQERPTFEELQHVVNEAGEMVETQVQIMDWLEEDPAGLDKTDHDGQAWLRLEWAWDFLHRGGLIISDRLHVHILSTLWGIDHVTIEEGEYAKLKTYHNSWLLQCEKNTYMARSVREGVDAAKAWYLKGGSFS